MLNATITGGVPGMVRLSFGAYTTDADIDRTVDAVALAADAGRTAAAATYRQGPDGTWGPRSGGCDGDRRVSDRG